MGGVRFLVYVWAVLGGLAVGLWIGLRPPLASAVTPTPTPAATSTKVPAPGTTPGAAPTPATPSACAFPGATVHAYEGGQDRQLYLLAANLAGWNMLFPGDPFFAAGSVRTGVRAARSDGPVYVPPTLLKAIAWIESSMTQGGAGTAWGTTGPALVSFDCGYGIMQVTSGMTVPLGSGQPTTEQSLVAEHYAYNTARGSVILADKWNSAPDYRPIAGTDTNSDPHIVENWYYAAWSYNGFTGPGANRSNHPLDPIYGAWPRVPYSCGAAGDGLGHNRGQYPYQELVFGCAAHPPIVQGQQLWAPLPLSLPDLNNPAYRNPLALANFVYPYAGMDIPSPAPWHNDTVAQPDPSVRQTDLGSPSLVVNQPMARFDITPDGTLSAPFHLQVSNPGTGVLPFRITTNQSWLTVSLPYGVAMGADLPCNNCTRTPDIVVGVDPNHPPQGGSVGVVTVEWLGSGTRIDIPIFVFQSFRLGVPGVVRD